VIHLRGHTGIIYAKFPLISCKCIEERETDGPFD
jgi:hypothetical protein